jgi:hypothetical protein
MLIAICCIRIRILVDRSPKNSMHVSSRENANGKGPSARTITEATRTYFSYFVSIATDSWPRRSSFYPTVATLKRVVDLTGLMDHYSDGCEICLRDCNPVNRHATA